MMAVSHHFFFFHPMMMRALVLLPTILYGFAQAALLRYTFDLAEGPWAPDGVQRTAYLINGTTPGPAITADQGDTIEVNVLNNLPVGTTLHWHGINQLETPWSDGVPGISQRLIPPGGTFLYRFNVTEHGIYWYHAHSRSLYGDGLRGTIYVRPASLDNNPFHLISDTPATLKAFKKAHSDPVILSFNDWRHRTSERDNEQWNKTSIDPLCVDSVLVNGQGQVWCPGAEAMKPYTIPGVVPERTAKGCALPSNKVVQPWPEAKPEEVDPAVFFECKPTSTGLHVVDVDAKAGWASIAFVSIADLWEYKVSIDGHPLWVYAADGGYVHPVQVKTLTIPLGERFQAFIKLDQEPKDYAIRIVSNSLPQVINGYGVLSYRKSNTPRIIVPEANPPSLQYLGIGAEVLNNATELNPLSQLKPWSSADSKDSIVPQKADVTLLFTMKMVSALEWTLNLDPYKPFQELQRPLLFDPSRANELGNRVAPNIPLGSVVDLVFLSSVENPPHPIHKHNHKAWIIGSGVGTFNWTSTAEAIKVVPEFFNLVDPPLRDGFNVVRPNPTEAGWMVVRYKVDVPSVTFMHCHVNAHNVAGMAIALLEGVDKLPTIPQLYQDYEKDAATYHYDTD